VNPGFCEKMEVTLAPPGRPSRTTSGWGGDFSNICKSHNSAATAREMKYTLQRSCDKTMDHPQNDLICLFFVFRIAPNNGE